MPTGDEIVLEIIGRLSIEGMCFKSATLGDVIYAKSNVPLVILQAELCSRLRHDDIRVALRRLHIEGAIESVDDTIQSFCDCSHYKATCGRLWAVAVNSSGLSLKSQDDSILVHASSGDMHPHYRLTPTGARRAGELEGTRGGAEKLSENAPARHSP